MREWGGREHFHRQSASPTARGSEHAIYHVLVPMPPTVGRLDRTSARIRVYDQLRALIEDAVLVPGETVRDVDIALQFGVSRTPVREAFQLLEQLGVLETLPNRHTRVTQVHSEDEALICPPLAALHAIAARTAVGHLSTGDLKEMAKANQALRESGLRGDKVKAREADYLFHGIILKRAGNRYLMAAIEPLQIHSRRIDTLYFSDPELSQDSYAAHQEILAALTASDSERAAELVAKNLMRPLEMWGHRWAARPPAERRVD